MGSVQTRDMDASGSRLIIRGGLVVDPANGIEDVLDILIEGDRIAEVGRGIGPRQEDLVIDASGLQVWPGLVDMHLHLGDLFDVDTCSIRNAVQDGVTTAFSPGAGNTFMAPALLGAEMDRGLPMNAGVFIGAQNMLCTMLDDPELVSLFRDELPEDVRLSKLSKNPFTNRLAPYVIGIKDHMGHFLMNDEDIRRVAGICNRAKLVYMSHTQDLEHAKRMVGLAAPIGHIHLTHSTAAGCGSGAAPARAMREIIGLCTEPNVSGDFVSTMIRKGLGSREGLQMSPQARSLCLEALQAGAVDILVSDGQNQSVMKGFGDTRDNIPCILELVEEGILPLQKAVATMTSNPVRLLGKITGRDWWEKRLGHLGAGAQANVTIVDADDKLATYTVVNGQVAAFENRLIRSGMAAGYWASVFGLSRDLGIGREGMYSSS